MLKRLLAACLLVALAAPAAAIADPPPFDLTGPSLVVSVTHDGKTLPISEVPNLDTGDQLAIRADLPASQSAHYLLVAAFLRGATNPPPKGWFYRAETWTKKGRNGLHITVPAEAQQVMVFLAPETGGDFDTLVGAVRGRPGAFVRATQALNQAALDRSRLDAFLAAVRKAGPVDPDKLKTVSPLLARSLTIKLNTDCFQRAPELQAACLMQGQDALILADGHSTSIVEALTTGPASDLAFQISAAPVNNYGYASPYIGAAFDLARILDSFRTAQYQYIPALALAHGERLDLLLNAPPSFHNPLSVLVTALPAVESPQPPPLRAVEPDGRFCAQRPDLVLPVEGAPLVYSTRYAHDMVLRTKTLDGKTVELPVTADAEKGGFVADARGLGASQLGPAPEGTLHGFWGFTPFDGPAFHLQTSSDAPWRLSEDSQQALVAGRDDVIRLEGGASACVARVDLAPPAGPREIAWKPVAADAVSATVPLTDAQPGPMTLYVAQYGHDRPDQVALQVFNQAARLDGFSFHAGDHEGVLKGARLDEVAGLTLGSAAFAPGELSSASGGDALTMPALDPAALTKLSPGQTVTAKVSLKDGRVIRLKTTVAGPRPSASLIAKTVQAAPPMTAHIQLSDPDELPAGAVLAFSLHADGATRFDGHETVEVAGPDGSVAATLTAQDGLVEQDPQVLVARLDTAKAFGPSVFGPLRFRLVRDGAASDWRPLATLVRLPMLRALKCREAPHGCELTGDNLFLLDSVASESDFKSPAKAPTGFTGQSMTTPRPGHDGRLYIRLRDDPQVVNAASFSP